MIAAESEITTKLHSIANYRTNCFELFGCDVILDEKLEPSLLEVNISPSLMSSSPLDKRIKVSILFIYLLTTSSVLISQKFSFVLSIVIIKSHKLCL